MTKKNFKWFLSALFGVLAIAFGFWLGISVLNWYSDREAKSDFPDNARPVSILSTQAREPKSSQENDEAKTDGLTSGNLENGEGLLTSDSLEIKNDNGLDSLFVGDEINLMELFSDTVVDTPALADYHSIKKDMDQLVATITFSIPKTTQLKSNTTLKLDSLLGNQPEGVIREDKILVELWKSPLNFRGYKFSNNVLVVYDITQLEALNLYYSGGKLYLSYFDVFYLISPTSQFKPLIPTSAPLLKE